MKRFGLATVIAMLCTVGATEAGGQPSVRDAAAANTLLATIVNTSEPGSSRLSVEIRGKVMAPSHKFAPRRCRAERTFDIDGPSVGGKTIYYGSSYPTRKSGRFTVGSPVEYAFTEDGVFHDGSVPESGETVTFVAHTGKTKVARKKGDLLASYTCRPLSITLQIALPPLPS
jgi:hypothetical protein